METLFVKVLFYLAAFVLYAVQIIGIPGNFAGPLVALIYLLATDVPLTWGRFVVMLLLALSGEAMDTLMGILGAKKFGASKKGMTAAVLGGFAGALVGGMIVPVAGSVIGVFLGIFLFTFLVEFRIEEKGVAEAKKAGWGAVLGRLAAMAWKYAAGLGILLLLAFSLFRTA